MKLLNINFASQKRWLCFVGFCVLTLLCVGGIYGLLRQLLALIE